jgi:hypothetical protein
MGTIKRASRIHLPCLSGSSGERVFSKRLAGLRDLDLWFNLAHFPNVPEIDVVVGHPDVGVFVIEVKAFTLGMIQSISAAKWCVEGRAETGSPSVQASRARDALTSFLVRHGFPADGRPAAAVALPMITRSEFEARFKTLGVGAQPESLLFKEDFADDASLAAALQRVREHPATRKAMTELASAPAWRVALQAALHQRAIGESAEATKERTVEDESALSLLAMPAGTLASWETMRRRSEALSGRLGGDDWRTLVAVAAALTDGKIRVWARDRRDIDGVMLDRLRTVGREAEAVRVQVRSVGRCESDAFRVWLDATWAHAESKAVDVLRLEAELRELALFRAEHELGRRDALRFELLRLTSANHSGRIEADLARGVEMAARGFDKIEPALWVQARLACLVQRTNALDFEAAHADSTGLRTWSQAPGLPVGLRGRILSQRGQLDAFVGRHADAARRFDEALALYHKLDEPDRSKERAQTSHYQVINGLCRGDRTTGSRSLVKQYRPLSETWMRRVATSVSPADKYDHYLLTRYLTSRGLEPADRETYLATAADWPEPPMEHPWQLISLHRAALLLAEGRRDDAATQLRRAIAICERPMQNNAVTTLRYMALVMRRCGFETKLLDAAPSDAEVAAVAAASPAMALRLRDFSRPIELGQLYAWRREMLPFNFG